MTDPPKGKAESNKPRVSTVDGLVRSVTADASGLHHTPATGGLFSNTLANLRIAGRADAPDQETATQVMAVVADVLQNGRARGIQRLPARDAEVVRLLWEAASGTANETRLDASARRSRLQQGYARLGTYLAVLTGDQAQANWVAQEITPYLDRLTRSIDRMVSEERITTAEQRVVAFTRGEHSILASLESADPEIQKRVLHLSVRRLALALAQLNEQLLRLEHGSHTHTEVTKELAHIKHAELPHELHGKISGAISLETLQVLLWQIDAVLTLSDDKLAEEIQEHHGPLGTVANVSELLKVAVATVAGVVQLSFSFAALVARLNGQLQWVAEANEFAKHSVHIFGDVIAGIEVVHGLAILLSDAPAEQKQEAAEHVVVGGSWLLLRGLGALGVEGAGALAGPVSTALTIGILELKLMARLYGEARVGLITGWLSLALETMREAARSISESGAMLANAGLLAAMAPDPDQRTVLGEVEQRWAGITAATVDHFLERCEPKTYGPGVGYAPGSYATLVQHFAPLMRFKGAKTPTEAAAAASATLAAIGWVFEHLRQIAATESGYPLRPEAGSDPF